MRRIALSRPVSLALEHGLISKGRSFFDYGCGRGGDLKRLHGMGLNVLGWDPAFFPDEERVPADVVNLGYVVNVVEDPKERATVLSAAWTLARRVLVIAARLEWEARSLNADFQGDGVVTRKGTFQKFFTQEELRDWIDGTLGVRAVAAAPGVFYVFRDVAEEQAFASARFRRRSSTPSAQLNERLYEDHREIIQPLMNFVAERGRLPASEELGVTDELRDIFGSMSAAFSLVRRVTGSDTWERIRLGRRQDLAVYLALSAFGQRPRFGQLGIELRLDIKAFFGSYRTAKAEADRLLYSAGNRAAVDSACRGTKVGKLLPDALYVHTSAVEALPGILRVYEGCGRQLAGTVDDATVIKLSRAHSKVSYLVYPDFDRVAHPALRESFIADLSRLRVHHRDYRQALNPFILHRKELFVGRDHPSRAKFEKLSAQEERAGLLAAESIGRQVQWQEHLARHGRECRGHRLVRGPRN
jgi:DNA phosphorothioation-associated putative methyltransferase